MNIKTENNEKFWLCACGYKEEIGLPVILSDAKKKHIFLGEGIAEQEKSLKGFPHICSKCSFEEAEIVDLGAFYGDESNVYLFKCKSCGFTERQADGASNG